MCRVSQNVQYYYKVVLSCMFYSNGLRMSFVESYREFVSGMLEFWTNAN